MCLYIWSAVCWILFHSHFVVACSFFSLFFSAWGWLLCAFHFHSWRHIFGGDDSDKGSQMHTLTMKFLVMELWICLIVYSPLCTLFDRFWVLKCRELMISLLHISRWIILKIQSNTTEVNKDSKKSKLEELCLDLLDV